MTNLLLRFQASATKIENSIHLLIMTTKQLAHFCEFDELQKKIEF